MTEWHPSASALRSYADERKADSQAWSVESHLIECLRCRRMINESPEVASIVEQVRTNLSGELPPQGRVHRPSRWRRWQVLLNAAPALRGAWLVAALFALTSSAALDLLSEQVIDATPWWSKHGSVLVLLAPILPALGVAVCYGRFGDPAYEITASTPFAGLRLVLWRTLSVVAVTVPTAALTGLVTGTASVATWLLPCLALTCLTLALGSVLRLEIAGTGVAVGWLVLAVGPLLARATPPLLAQPLPLLWSGLIAVSLTVLYARRSAFHSTALNRS